MTWFLMGMLLGTALGAWLAHELLSAPDERDSWPEPDDLDDAVDLANWDPLGEMEEWLRSRDRYPSNRDSDQS